jgi:hypothetical protein
MTPAGAVLRMAQPEGFAGPIIFRVGSKSALEQIQDVAEQTLIAANHLATARAYIVYREQHASCALTSRRWWMWKAPSTNTSRAPTGA